MTGARDAVGLTTLGRAWVGEDRGATSGIPTAGDGVSSGIAAEGGIEGSRGGRSAGSSWDVSMNPPGASGACKRAGVVDAARIDCTVIMGDSSHGREVGGEGKGASLTDGPTGSKHAKAGEYSNTWIVEELDESGEIEIILGTATILGGGESKGGSPRYCNRGERRSITSAGMRSGRTRDSIGMFRCGLVHLCCADRTDPYKGSRCGVQLLKSMSVAL